MIYAITLKNDESQKNILIICWSTSDWFSASESTSDLEKEPKVAGLTGSFKFYCWCRQKVIPTILEFLFK